MYSVKLIFIIGQTSNNETQNKIYDESETYRDLVQESFIDTYNNLTLKTIMMFKWVTNNCNDKGNYLFDLANDVSLILI